MVNYLVKQGADMKAEVRYSDSPRSLLRYYACYDIKYLNPNRNHYYLLYNLFLPIYLLCFFSIGFQ
jgi:hypothetical protein